MAPWYPSWMTCQIVYFIFNVRVDMCSIQLNRDPTLFDLFVLGFWMLQIFFCFIFQEIYIHQFYYSHVGQTLLVTLFDITWKLQFKMHKIQSRWHLDVCHTPQRAKLGLILFALVAITSGDHVSSRARLRVAFQMRLIIEQISIWQLMPWHASPSMCFQIFIMFLVLCFFS